MIKEYSLYPGVNGVFGKDIFLLTRFILCDRHDLYDESIDPFDPVAQNEAKQKESEYIQGLLEQVNFERYMHDIFNIACTSDIIKDHYGCFCINVHKFLMLFFFDCNYKYVGFAFT